MDFNPNEQYNNVQNGNGANGQNIGFNGYNQNPQGNSYRNPVPPYVPHTPPYIPPVPPQYQQYQPIYQYPVNPEFEKKQKDKKILKSMSTAFGIAVIIYVVVSNAFVFGLYLLSRYSSVIYGLLNNSTGQYILQSFLSVFFIGGPFLISYLILRKKKYVGILPYGTAYNKKAAISLTMFLIPIMLISTIAVNLISYIFQSVVGITFESGMDDMTVDGPIGALALIISLAVIPAFVEEFCIRGVVLQPLRRYGDKFAIVVSALIFSILHGNMVQIPYTLVAGIYLGYLCVATGSIWPSIILHFVNNMYSAVQLIVLAEFGETASTVAAYVMLGAFVVIGIVGGIIFFRMNYKADLKKGVNTLKTGEKIGAVLSSPALIIAIVFMLLTTAASVVI